MGEFVSLEVADGIGTIRLARPPMNALSLQVQQEIKACAQEATERDDVKVVILYGGEKVFAAGADVKEMAVMDYQQMVLTSGPLQDAFTSVARIPKPTIAAITGYALGGGCELTLCCDIRIAADDATLGQPEILLGIIPGAGGTQRLARLIGPSKTKDLVFTGRFVPAADVYAEALKLATKLAKGPALALRAAKEAIDRGLEVDLVTGLEIERMAFTSLFATDDRKIGMDSFVENGPGKAVFTGR